MPIDIQPTVVVLIDDGETLRQFAQIVSGQYTLRSTADSDRAIHLLESEKHIAAIVVHQAVRSGRALSTLELALSARPEVPRLFITAFLDLSDLIAGLHNGAITRAISSPLKKNEVIGALLTRPAVAAASSVSAHS